MGKRKNSPNKDDKSWIEPETKKVKKKPGKMRTDKRKYSDTRKKTRKIY